VTLNTAGKAKLLSGGAVASAVTASICCFGPLALAVLGLGGGAFLSTVEPLRPYSLATAGLLLGGAFYLSYGRRSREECEPGSSCDRPESRRRQKFALWTAAIVVVLAATFPYYSRWLL
jgi:mercuric ion transport protein